MSLATLFTITEKWEQSKFPLTDKWMKATRNTHT